MLEPWLGLCLREFREQTKVSFAPLLHSPFLLLPTRCVLRSYGDYSFRRYSHRSHWGFRCNDGVVLRCRSLIQFLYGFVVGFNLGAGTIEKQPALASSRVARQAHIDPRQCFKGLLLFRLLCICLVLPWLGKPNPVAPHVLHASQTFGYLELPSTSFVLMTLPLSMRL